MNETEQIHNQWFYIKNVNEVCSPSLLVYPDRIEENIKRMIKIAGSSENLRPHVKTHKMEEVLRLQMKHGISKFKCSTISEAEMVARCGAPDILLAMQPVGPNLERFFKLQQIYVKFKFSCIADCDDVVIQLSDMARSVGIETDVWLDINNGMNRTGVIPGEKALRIYKRIIDSPMLVAKGLHVYDGHIHDTDPAERKTKCEDAFAPVSSMIGELMHQGITPVNVIAGGTPSFTIHAGKENTILSPGTLILWDYRSSSSLPDMDFLHAAVLLMRIVSKPANDLLCLDLGHKAIASEMEHPRVKILGINNYTVTGHNEEHLVIKTNDASSYKTGDHLYGIPWHICPTVDRYDSVNIIRGNKIAGKWNVVARKRKITI